MPPIDSAKAVRRLELEVAWAIETRPRVQFVLDHARGTRVLDLGCVNHSDQAMNAPSWLHLQICGLRPRVSAQTTSAQAWRR